jgi:hypothetical protein
VSLSTTQLGQVALARRVGLDLSQLPADGTKGALPSLRWYRTAIAARDAYLASLGESPDPASAGMVKLRSMVEALRVAAEAVRAQSVPARTSPGGGAPSVLSGSGWSAIVEATSTGLDLFLDVLVVSFT